ncbi:MAG: MarR family winged helix-turn-helix transcriptional regulator [Eubacteriaceae bacterium]|jgi:DNA-binding MarR family transcriptional regulator|nr:MarR family winged helix-turn-helix transcriptional regulator [Eubacteriaceae bacterium]MDD4508080.1 MarR family winged helix-turn-helix transcriptional regulator [Eubacteriaceae bacterium]
MPKEPFVSFNIKTLSHMIKHHIDRAICRSTPGDVPPPTGVQGFIIGFIAHHDGHDIFQRDIERELHIRRSTATGILKLMEKNGWIIREPVPYDARLKKIILTPKALNHHHYIMSLLDQTEAKLVRNISNKDLAVFNRVIEQMKKNLEATP